MHLFIKALQIVSNREPGVMARQIASQLVDLFDDCACFVYEWDDPENQPALLGYQIPSTWPETKESFLNTAPFLKPELCPEAHSKETTWISYTGTALKSAQVRFQEEITLQKGIIIPMQQAAKLVGILEVLGRTTTPLNQEHIDIVQYLARHYASALNNALAYQKATQHSLALEAIVQANLRLTASLNLEDVLQAILERSLSLIKGIDDTHIFLYKQGTLHFGAALWADGSRGRVWSHPRPGGITNTVARKGTAVVIPDMQASELFRDTSWTGAIIGLPLKIGPRVVGVMTAACHEPRNFSVEEMRTLRLLGDQAAIAIENARLHSLVNQQARTDILTGLPNRRALDERLDEEIRRSNRYQHPFTFVMIDLDGFKRINDTYGHLAGDKALHQIAHYLSSTIRDTDFLARYGGDEFGLILPETNQQEARQIMERLKTSLLACGLALPQKITLDVHATMGLAVFPDQATSAEELIAQADSALYRAKNRRS